MKILVVEDSSMDILALQALFESDDYELRCVTDALKAVEESKSMVPDLILLDIKMPGMDGYEVCKLLKADRITQNIPVIFITGKNTVEDEIKGFEIGAVDYIRKPFHEKVTRRRIKTHLDLVQKERELLQAKKMEALGTFAGGIAHEFNNLFFVILGNTELLIDDARVEDKDLLQAILKSIKRGSDLVKQLLALSRKYESNLHVTDLNAEILRVEKMLNVLIPKTVVLELDFADALYTVNTDKGQMEQVLMNLCLNALEAMPDGGKLTIKTENAVLDDSFLVKYPDAKKGKCIRLTISDTGFGMEKGIRERIFEPFFTTKVVGEGAGLGLAVIYGIVKGHRGIIECRSELNVGTSFIIYLPAANADVHLPYSGEPAGKTQR